MAIHHLRTFILTGLCVVLVVVLPTAGTVHAGEAVPTPQPVSAAATDVDPLGCIIPLQVAHIAASIAAVLPIPIPGFTHIAAMAEFGANLGLKGCPPHLVPPKDIVKDPPPGCVLRLYLPLSEERDDMIDLDIAVSNDVELNALPSDLRRQIRELTAAQFGRFENTAYGSYSSFYGFVIPQTLHVAEVKNWGDIGAPEIYHYNSDVEIILRHPGQRVDGQFIEVRPGSYTLAWEANTQISEVDKIPLFLISSFTLAGAGKHLQQKAAKEAAVKLGKETVKKAAKEAAEAGTSATIKTYAKLFVRNIAKKGFDDFNDYARFSFLPTETSATSVASQRLIVLDANPPTIQGADAPVVVEAFRPGGAASGATVPALVAALVVADDCDPNPTLTYATPAFWPLLVDANGTPLPSATIRWIARDNGARDASGGVNETVIEQQVIVQDTLPPIILPPPPVIMESSSEVEVPLGSPQVFDVADLRPAVTYHAPGTTQGSQWPIFGQGVHQVEWQATDASQNASEVKTQLVNIKAPGTNIPPVAFAISGAQTVQAIADEPITITVRGQDGNNPPDPIWFTVEDRPQNGFFHAPLYPYFIDDYRMTARYSPQIAQWEGEAFALQVAQDPEAMRQYIIQLCEADINRTDLPKDFVSWNGGDQKYIAVDDEGYIYIYDWAYRRCTHGGSTISPNGSPRISVWDPDGIYVGEQERSASSYPLRDVKFNVARRTIISVESDSSTTGNSLVNISAIQPQNPAEPIVDEHTYTLWNGINRIVVNDNGDTRRPEYKNAGAAAWDEDAGVLYVIGDPGQNLRGMAAFTPAPCDTDPEGDPEACLDLLGVQVYSLPLVQSTQLGDFPGVGVNAMRLEQIRDVALDSQGNVYVLARQMPTHRVDRIFKFAPATVNADGSVTLGELIGWMGKCDSGPNCNYIDQHSIGFACTDATCAVDATTYGSGPGQFDNATAIAVDPNDVLYVADGGNERVQRFSGDGLFAGEARSQSSCPGCSGFVLGDFGAPGNIAVNSNHFYILDIDTELVHVFETSVIHSIDNSSAWVEYQSDSNYVGADFFTFKATDGFRTANGELIESAPARVDIDVSRNFRPPQATVGLVISTTVDTPAPITLSGYDLDGALDTLTYEVVESPALGTLTGQAPNLTFTPDPDVYGTDSFTFVVKDGRFTSEPETVAISIAPANRPPEVQFEADTLTTGIGYALTLAAQIVDPDYQDTHTITVDWGDGTMENGGSIEADGSLSGPVVSSNTTFTSTVTGYHHYASGGTFTLNVCATDPDGVQACSEKPVHVVPMVDVALSREGATIAQAGDRHLAYDLVVRINQPQSGQVTAQDIVVTETLTSGAVYQGATTTGGSCVAGGQNLHCQLDPLAGDTSVRIQVQVEFSDSLEPGDTVRAWADTSHRDPDPIPENNVVVDDLILAHSADFLVNSVEEGQDAAPGDGVCRTAEGICTLRAAVQEANALAGGQTIALGYGIYQLNLEEEQGQLRLAAQAEDSAASGDLDITGDLAILGLSPDRTILHANGADRVLEIHGVTVSLSDLMLTGGKPADNGEGGGLRILGGDVRLERVAVTGNEAANGAGIANNQAQLSIKDSAITDNLVSGTGSGGGILNQAGTLLVENSTLSRNRAHAGGGLQALGGSAELTNVTLLGNSADNVGGGINVGGGSVTLLNTILANNGAPIGPECAPNVDSAGFNLLGIMDGCTLQGSTQGNINTSTPRLADIERNEAETYSYTPLTTSMAIDNGSCVLETDQRGVSRPFGAGCDIGAIEYDTPTGTPPDHAVYLPVVQRGPAGGFAQKPAELQLLPPK